MTQDFETYLQQAREDFCKVAYKYNITDHLELRTEVDSLLIAYDQAVEALRKHGVVRGGDLKHYPVQAAANQNTYPVINTTGATPTGQLPAEWTDLTVCDGIRG